MTNENAVKGMSIKKKALIVLCALVSVVVIVATSVLATVAYLTSSATVSNVFTIGKVGITMTESKVDSEGRKIVGEGAAQVDTNSYHLVPNKTYDKDPTIHVNDGSEDSYLFITVRNDLERIADATDPTNKPTIAQQLKKNGWAQYTTVATGNVYVYVGCEANNDVVAGAMTAEGKLADGAAACLVNEGDYKLFEQFSISKTADVSAYGAAKININAFAIQDSGLTTVAAAWDAVLDTYPYIHSGTTTGGTTGGNTSGNTGSGS